MRSVFQQKIKRAALFAPLAVFFAMALFASENTEEADFRAIKKVFNNSIYDLAQDRLETFMHNYPATQHIYEAHILLGRCYGKGNNRERAFYEFDAVLRSPSAVEFHDAALYWSGEERLNAGDYKKALGYFQNIIDNFPESSYMGYAVYSKGWAYYSMDLLDDALACFREVVSRYQFEKIAAESQFRIGECEYLLGRYSTAEEDLERFINKFPLSAKTAEVYYLIGETNFYRARYADSIKSFERAISMAPRARMAAFARYRIAACLLRLGDFEASQASYRKCMELTNDRFIEGMSLLGIAQGYERLRLPNEAEKIYYNVIEDYPDSDIVPAAYCRLAGLLRRSGKFEPAEAICEEALMKFSKSGYLGELRYELGRIYMDEGRLEEALKEFSWVRTRSEDSILSASAICKTGDAHYIRKEYVRAAENYDILLTKYSDSPWVDYAQYKMGNVFLLTGKTDQAILAYKSVFANFPKTKLRDVLMLNTGIAYYKKGNFNAASQELEKFLNEFPKTYMREQAEMYLANSLYGLNRYNDALSIYRRLAKGAADENIKMMAKYQTGWCLYNMRKESEAFGEFADFMRRYPDSDMAADAQFWLADFYRAHGKFAKSEESFESIIRGRQQDMVEEASYNLALTLSDEGRLDEAALGFEEFAAKYPDSNLARTCYRKIAKIKKERKDIDSAIAYMRKAITTEDNDLNAQTQYEIAELMEQKGDLDRAAEEYLKVPHLYSKGAFWSVRSELKCAQIFEKLNKAEEAKHLYGKLAGMDVKESELARARLEQLKGGY